ncbi:hypothetical protein CLAFUW4_20037 [Fulvia fulva]|uniref:uncharacterized protein n=1 Tax=Passalora fulva TaxID=5499 RepID=UPI0028528AFC|nr:uncharacterized protein CLAFUR5_20037 [Fulvia fulva]KAK4626389.1 hypothetical protein CLAFUR4_20037 [Fulvia fulva]KAK4628530.1 hypothetical protein CLAFUR0_20037 [Fulvia fulva]WMI38867.1 hypothetical protein CLAFUR5_20037 [Fulvia fulva]WPV13994.1 hypothetical protein CLAFUW4_20037 [Fulvia fulva]WPV28526.1 hypothetical protein CLAFUW7_20037 [Fulvia fulva]
MRHILLLCSRLLLICAGLAGSVAATWTSLGGRRDVTTGDMAECRYIHGGCFPWYGGAWKSAMATRARRRKKRAGVGWR